jgi:hypothetical protein
MWRIAESRRFTNMRTAQKSAKKEAAGLSGAQMDFGS